MYQTIERQYLYMDLVQQAKVSEDTDVATNKNNLLSSRDELGAKVPEHAT